MRHVIAFSNQKGGVGKTTLCREIGIYLAATGRPTLMIDLDPQGNLTKSLLEAGQRGSVVEAIKREGLSFVAVSENLSMLPADNRLAAVEKELVTEIDGYTRLKELLLDPAFERYECVLIDSPPSFGMLSVNALVVATGFVIPMSPALYTMQGTNDLMTTVEKVRRNFNPTLGLFGVVINEFDRIPVITREIREEITGAFGSAVFPTTLSRSVKVEEAIARKRGLVDLPDCKVKRELASLGAEFAARMDELSRERAAI